MSGDVQAGSSRPRPLSGGFWTLLSWLRREEHSSNDSLSSAGSDRTAVSIAFLNPAHYHSTAPPLILPPPGPPTDTYKKRVRERNLRRQYDRDTTLHRKYGLFRGEGITGYETIGLPPTRRFNSSVEDKYDRERRATSECYQRRIAHVPGKRRAPLPPVRENSRGTSLDPLLTVTRRQTRKRPAPQPPNTPIEKSKENIFESCQSKINVIQMNNKSVGHGQKVMSHETPLEADCKPEKFVKKASRDNKIRPEKSFLKQIFDSKKRNSASVDITTVKVLPSISELDKQAAEIIENNKLKNTEERNSLKSILLSNNSFLHCPKCPQNSCFCNKTPMTPSNTCSLQQKNASTIYTQTERDISSNKNSKVDDKQVLKDMLKEMKDSLPKRAKHEVRVENSAQKNKSISAHKRDNNISNTPTLRIGSSSSYEVAKELIKPLIANKESHELRRNQIDLQNTSNATQDMTPLIQIEKQVNSANITAEEVISNKNNNSSLKEDKRLHTPLKISSLLNPIYVPKNTDLHPPKLPKILETKPEDEKVVTLSNSNPIYVKTADTVRDIILNSCISGNLSASQVSKSALTDELNKKRSDEQLSLTEELSKNVNPQNSLISNTPVKSVTNIAKINEHSRRRELVQQLEHSIAKGDERAAAEAASKLAQLRLSCSVLSYSSQILGAPSTSSSIFPNQKNITLQNDTASNKSVQPSAANMQGKSETTQKTKGDSMTGVFKIKNNVKSTITQIEENKDGSASSSARASTSKEISANKADDNMAVIDIWVEDKEKARGPIQLRVKSDASVGDLRYQAEHSLGLPARLQRWIVGRSLCTDDKIPLTTLAGSTLKAPFYLCLVESDAKNIEAVVERPEETNGEIGAKKLENNVKKISSDVYSELVDLERQALIPNTEIFECEICMEQCNVGDGVVLRECVHSFCKGCLSDVIRHCEEPMVSCPATGCPGELHEREIRALVNAEEYQRWLARGLVTVESGARNAFHCRTRDCTGWALCEIDVRRFPCPVCKHTNCVPCQAIHENETCEQYQAKLTEATSNKADDEGTRALIDSLISRGEALQCPECSTVITKKWGCDWVKCSACKTEICWVTRGRRWGPGGRGDVSGGCRCGVDGKRCHPTCAYCH